MSECQHCQETEDSTHPISAKLRSHQAFGGPGCISRAKTILRSHWLIAHSHAWGINANGLPLDINL
jgi:hypothetical protein